MSVSESSYISKLDYVSREKYDILKEKAKGWRNKALENIKQLEELQEENEKLQEENDELKDNLQDKLLEITNIENTEFKLNEEVKLLQETLSKYKEKYSHLKKKLKQIQKDFDEERLIEKLSKRINNN